MGGEEISKLQCFCPPADLTTQSSLNSNEHLVVWQGCSSVDVRNCCIIFDQQEEIINSASGKLSMRRGRKRWAAAPTYLLTNMLGTNIYVESIETTEAMKNMTSDSKDYKPGQL